MKSALTSLNAVLVLSGLAFLSCIARLILDVGFVPEIFNAMPEDQPIQTGLVMLFFITLFGGWLWTLLAAARDSRRGLIGLLVCNLLISVLWSMGTLGSFCPTPCDVVYPITDIVTWLNVIVGLLAALSVALYLRDRNRRLETDGR